MPSRGSEREPHHTRCQDPWLKKQYYYAFLVNYSEAGIMIYIQRGTGKNLHNFFRLK